MICAQRLLRRARATDEEEMMEIHLEKSNGKKKTKTKKICLQYRQFNGL